MSCGKVSRASSSMALGFSEYDIARSEPLLAPLGLSLEAALESLPEASLPVIAQRSADEYAALRRRAALLRDIIAPHPIRKGLAT